MPRDVCVYDYETTGKNKHNCQLTQIGAMILDGRNFRVKDTFNSEVRPLYFEDEEAVANGWGPIEDEALEVTGKTIEGLKAAPTFNVVWPKFCSFIKKHNFGKSSWTAPIAAGYNIDNFDTIITDRLCREFGPWDEKFGSQNLFNPIKRFDVMQMLFHWTESDNAIRSISMDNMRIYTGLSGENAHDAFKDVKDTANILIKLLKTQRAILPSLKLQDCFANGELYVQ